MSVALKGSRVLITGGAGFVGSTITDQLLAEDVKEVVLLDNLVRGKHQNIEAAVKSGKVNLIEGDIRDRNVLDRVSENIDYCFHMAALRITHCAEFPREALEVMYDGTFNVLEACVKHKIKRLVFASSASVYGQADEFPTEENHHPYNNYTLYGAAKMANELMLRSFHHMYQLNYCALRYFNIYGPRMDTHGRYTEVLIRWYHLIKEGKPPVIFGDGHQTMDFVYIDDVARANVLAMKSGVNNEAINVAEGEETSLRGLCEALLDVMGSELEPTFIPVPQDRQKVEVYRRKASVDKARQLIQFERQVGLKEGLAKLVSWLDEQAVMESAR